MPELSGPNPLLTTSFSSSSPIPFDQIRPEHVEAAIGQLLKDANTRLESVRSLNGAPTYDTVLGKLEASTEALEVAITLVSHLESVATTPELRAVYNKVLPTVTSFFSSIPLDDALWKSVKAFADTDEARSLTGARKRLVKKTLDSFRRQGADLPPDKKKALSEIDVELTKVTNRFAENVLDSTASFELLIDDESRLSGLPESSRAAAAASAKSKEKTGWRFTLQEPSFVPVVTYADDPSLREELWRAYNTRATTEGRDNRPLIGQIIDFRKRKATVLGFANFADFVLEKRMAKTGGRAAEFLEDLKTKSTTAFQSECSDLQAFQRELTGDPSAELHPWDVAYYSEKLRRQKYDFDEEALRPYFSFDVVLSGLFDLVNKLYGIDVVELDDIPTWNETVRTFALEDGGVRLGIFYTDFLPRESKRPGAWMHDLFIGTPRSPDDARPHFGVICGNVTPPVDDRPSLLTHREVETIFHEFGHLLHHLLTEVSVKSLAGTHVAWDFVELPSQIMENWCWERESLDLFARHYETGERLPDQLFDKMNKARTFRGANAMMRQLGFGLTDLALHTTYDREQDGDPIEYCRKYMGQFSPAKLPEEWAMVCGFPHVFGNPVGYAAGYYSYKWAEVLDADAFTAFKQAGIFDRETGMKFRKTILANGDQREPGELYREFMGRDPNTEALLERSGLATSTSA